MADKEFNWWELAGGAIGAGAGFLAGLPVGQPIAGAGLGYGIGTAISPGGYWNEKQPDAAMLPQTESAGVTAAALKEMEAARNMMRQEIGTGVQNIRQRYGQAGTFQSGARGRAEDAFRQKGLESLSGAFAGIELDAVRARQQGASNTLALQMQQANFAWQKQQQENAMLTSLITTALPFFMKDGQNDPSLSLDPTQAFGDIGLDPFLAQAPNWQLGNPQQTQAALTRIGG